MLDGERKSVEPMAEHLGIPRQHLAHFIAQSTCDYREVMRRVAAHTDRLLRPSAWLIDDHLVTRYAWRWSIEVTFAKARDLLGAGQARSRTRHAVERTVPFAVYCYTITVVRAARPPPGRRRRAARAGPVVRLGRAVRVRHGRQAPTGGIAARFLAGLGIPPGGRACGSGLQELRGQPFGVQ